MTRKPYWHKNKAFLFPSISGREAPGLLLLFRGFSSHQVESTWGGSPLSCQCFPEHQRARKPSGFKQGWHCGSRKLPAEQKQGAPGTCGNSERHVKNGEEVKWSWPHHIRARADNNLQLPPQHQMALMQMGAETGKYPVCIKPI